MKIINLEEFKALVADGNWQREVDHEVIDRVEKPTTDCDNNEVMVGHTYGWATLTSTLGDIEITYEEGFSYDDYEPDTFATSTDGLHSVWSVKGLTVIDPDYDNEEIDAHDLADYLSDEFSSIKYDFLQIQQTDDIDVTEDDTMEIITLEINNAPNIRFTGELVASASSSDNQAMGSSYSGETGRWTELALYKTASGKYVCHEVGRTRWQGEHDRYSGEVCETLDQVIEFFGHRWLAKELYAEAGIDDAVEVE